MAHARDVRPTDELGAERWKACLASRLRLSFPWLSAHARRAFRFRGRQWGKCHSLSPVPLGQRACIRHLTTGTGMVELNGVTSASSQGELLFRHRLPKIRRP